jgi:hypothetical protein
LNGQAKTTKRFTSLMSDYSYTEPSGDDGEITEQERVMDPAEQKIVELNYDLAYATEKVNREQDWHRFACQAFDKRAEQWNSRCHSRAEAAVLWPQIQEWKMEMDESAAKLIDLDLEVMQLKWKIWLVEHGLE